MNRRDSSTVVKRADVSHELLPAISRNAVSAAPPPQLCKTAPSGSRTRKHRTDPVQAVRASPNERLGGIGALSRLPQPVMRCKRRSQLSRDRIPVRPHVLRALPRGYAEGDVGAIAAGGYPAARNALGTAKQSPGQHQGRRLVNAEPVPLHELHPADDRAESRVDLTDLHTPAVPSRQEIRLRLAVTEARQHAAVPSGIRLPGRPSSWGSPAVQERWACRRAPRSRPRGPRHRRSRPRPGPWTCRR